MHSLKLLTYVSLRRMTGAETFRYPFESRARQGIIFSRASLSVVTQIFMDPVFSDILFSVY